MNNSPIIFDATNRYYAGMTLTEAKKLGIDKSFWRRDFHNIDKNGDNILSADEIIKERKRSSKQDKIMSGIFAGWGIYDVIDSIKNKSKGWLIIGLAIDTYLIYNCLSRAIKNDKQTKEYENIIKEKQINRYA